MGGGYVCTKLNTISPVFVFPCHQEAPQGRWEKSHCTFIASWWHYSPRNSNKAVACGLAVTVKLLILFQVLAVLSVRKIIP